MGHGEVEALKVNGCVKKFVIGVGLLEDDVELSQYLGERIGTGAQARPNCALR